jgi:hypothetical protein
MRSNGVFVIIQRVLLKSREKVRIIPLKLVETILEGFIGILGSFRKFLKATFLFQWAIFTIWIGRFADFSSEV